MNSAATLSPADLQILGSLLRSPAGVDTTSFRHEFGATPPQVTATITRLQQLGCELHPTHLSGWRLQRASLEVWQDYLEHFLRATGHPRQVSIYRQIRSTQDAARQLERGDAVVLADEQTAGRGRLGRRWLAPPGTAVLLSLTHRLRAEDRDSHDHLQYLVAVAVAQALERITQRKLIQIKWPNDLVADNRKLAGILIETMSTPNAAHLAIIGIGINVIPVSPHHPAIPDAVHQRIITLHDLGGTADRLAVAAEVIAQVDRQLLSPHQKLLLDEWRNRNVLHNHHATFQTDGHTFTGTVLDLDPLAGLIVRCDDGTLTHLHAATTSVLQTE